MVAWVHLNKPGSDDGAQQQNTRDGEQEKQVFSKGLKLLGLDQMFQFNKRPLSYVARILNLQ